MVKFKVHHRWAPKAVAVRVAQAVRGEGFEEDAAPPWETSEGHWQLDRGNDWFLTQTGDHEYQLSYRYTGAGRPVERQQAIEGLVSFLTTFVFS